MTSKATQLIEQRLGEIGDGYYMDGYDVSYDDAYDPVEYPYTCLDTGMQFETYGEFATYSPFTGSTNISADLPYEEEKQETPTPIPSSQKDPLKQVPVAANPVPAGAKPMPDNKPAKPNPAPDSSGSVGATSADGKGYVK